MIKVYTGEDLANKTGVDEFTCDGVVALLKLHGLAIVDQNTIKTIDDIIASNEDDLK